MTKSALDDFIQNLSAEWGPLTSRLTLRAKELIDSLTRECRDEQWVKDLVRDKAPEREVYRSEEHGFILMGHFENAGEFSPPHDHGAGWVIYSTVVGQTKMGIYHHVIGQTGQHHLVQKDSYMLLERESAVYLPGDIHDTEALVDGTVTLRLTSCDFNREVEEGRLIRFLGEVEKWS